MKPGKPLLLYIIQSNYFLKIIFSRWTIPLKYITDINDEMESIWFNSNEESGKYQILVAENDLKKMF